MTEGSLVDGSAGQNQGAKRYGVLALLVVLFAVSVVAALRVNEQFTPDSRYYSAMAFHYSGMTEDEARQETVAANELQGWETPPTSSLFGWGLVQPRVIYPTFSAPFVRLFGLPGMLVVPILSMLFLVLAAYRVIERHFGVAAALGISLLALSSHFVFYWGTAMLTEGPAAAVGTGIFLTLPIWGEPRKRWDLPICVILLAAMAFTRQAALIPGAAIVVAAMGYTVSSRQLWNRWSPFALWAVGTTVGTYLLQAYIWPGFSIQTHYMDRVAETTNVADAVAAIPSVVWTIFVRDINQFIFRDQALLVLLVVAGAAFVVSWNRTEAHLLAGALGATMLLNILNGTPTAFRYAMPGLIFFLVAGASTIARALQTYQPSARGGPVDEHA